VTKRDTTVGPTDKVPAPAPGRREKPLPWQSPKAAKEDRDAPARVAAILNSKGYLQADEDIGFLQSDDMRGVTSGLLQRSVLRILSDDVRNFPTDQG